MIRSAIGGVAGPVVAGAIAAWRARDERPQAAAAVEA